MCGGYEVDIFLLCSARPMFFFALFLQLSDAIQPFWGFSDAMGTTVSAKSLHDCYFYF